MNWTLLLPSTFNPFSVIPNLFASNSGIASQALSDAFILITIGIAIIFGISAVKLTRDSMRTMKQYIGLLPDEGADAAAILKSDLPLFRDLQHHIISLPNRDGSNLTSLRRTIEAAEIFSDSKLAPGFTTSRLFLSLPGLLTGIGVLGTFVGLQMGIGGLDLKDLKKLETSVVPLIQGCAIAFSTSVWGVLASLLFGGFEKYLEWLVLTKIRRLQIVIDGLIPRYVPEEAMADMERASRGTEEILKGLAVAIGDQMQKAIGRLGNEIKEAVANATSEGQGPLMEKSAELLANAITLELGNLKEQIGVMSEQFSSKFSGASEELMKSVQSFEPTIKTLSETVGLAQQSVVIAVNKLTSHEKVMEKMATAATEIRQAAESFATMNDTLRLSATQNEEAAKSQLLAAEANKQVAEKFSHVGDRLPEIRETLEDAARVIASISGPIVDLKTYLEKLPDSQKSFEDKRAISEDERNRQLLIMTGNLAEKVGKAAEQFSNIGSLAEKLNTAATSLDVASNGLATFGNNVFKSSEAQRAASEASHAAALSGERTAKALEPLPEAITGLTTGLQSAGASVRTGAEAARDSYRELITLQKHWFSGAELGLNGMKDRLQSILKAYGDQVEGQTQKLMHQWTNEVATCLRTYETQVEQLQGNLEEIQAVLSRLAPN